LTRAGFSVRRIAELTFTTVAVSAIACVGVLTVEAAARALAPDYLLATRGILVRSDTYGWRSRRNVSGLFDGKRITLNAHGFRGRALSAASRAGRTRVIVLGDSIAFGFGVSDEETFTYLLDARDNRIEAANLAVPGYGPGQELLLLLREGLAYEPDVVVLAFCQANDLVDATLPVSLYDGVTPKPRFRLEAGALVLDRSALEATLARELRWWLSDNSHIFGRLSTLGRRSAPPGDTGWHARYARAIEDPAPILALNLAIVRRTRDVCQRRGIRFLLAAFPDRSTYHGEATLARRFVEAVERERIEVLDLSPHLRAVGLRFLGMALDGTGHLNPIGQRIACEALETRLARGQEERAP
jgi:hypothetical protein